MFDKVLDMPQDHLNCFAVVLRGIYGKVDICQTDYSINSKQRIVPYSNVIHVSTTFELTKGEQGLKKNNQLLNLMFLFFLLFYSFQCTKQKVSKTEVVRAIFYMHQTSRRYAGECRCNDMHQIEKIE